MARADGARADPGRRSTDFQAVAGQGIAATVDGRALLLGNAARCWRRAASTLDGLSERGASPGGRGQDADVRGAWTAQLAGLIAVADTLKPESARGGARAAGAGPGGVDADRRQPAHRGGDRRARSASTTCWPRCCRTRRRPRSRSCRRQGKRRGDGGRRHQRRPGAGPGRPGHRHRHRGRRGDGSVRHHAGRRRPARRGHGDRPARGARSARSARTCSGPSSTTSS